MTLSTTFRRFFGLVALFCAACGSSEDDSDGSNEAAPELLSFACRGSARTSTEPTALADPNVPTLRAVGPLVGTAIGGSRLADADYAKLVGEQFNYATPENEMKWDATEGTAGQFTFTSADAIVDFAVAHQMKVRGHTLIWHSQLPSWVAALTGVDAVREAMARHIQGVMSHFREKYPGVVVSWDVVNEAIDTPMGVAGFRDSVFYRELGEDYVAEAFQLAREADPDARLYYNDYGIEGSSAKANAAYEMIKKLVEAGVPIDGVGFQMHAVADDRGPSHDELQANIQRYVDLGLKVNISEMDVNLCRNSNGAFGLEQQRFRYNRIVSTCLASGACESVAVWGALDKASWLNNSDVCSGAPYQPMPLLFDDKLQKKPAFWGFYDALNGCYYD